MFDGREGGRETTTGGTGVTGGSACPGPPRFVHHSVVQGGSLGPGPVGFPSGIPGV